MLSTRSKGEANLTNFTDNPERIGSNKSRRRSKIMADTGNKDPQHQETEEDHQEPQDDETEDTDTAALTEMYLPNLDNTPLSQALKRGLDWGMEDEVMVECPKHKQYFGVDTVHVQRISVLTIPTPKSPGESRKTKGNTQGSTRRRLALETQDHPR